MKIAVIGSGIAGLSCAYELNRRHRRQVTLFEAADHLGGHTNTVDVHLDGVTHPVDTGFLVFNERTYPQLVRLFAELGVPTAASEMSFSVSLEGSIEWAGTNLATVFAQPSNLLRPRFIGMLMDIARFNREASAAAATHLVAADSLGDYLKNGRYGSAFRDWYLLPMAAAIWSCPTATMLAYPFATFARFCHNHGLLQVTDRPQWRTVQGGGREYVKRLAAGIADIRLNRPVRKLVRTSAGVLVHSATGSGPADVERFDQVVLACHSDQALKLLHTPSQAESEILGAVRYQPNIAYLHTDPALLPRRKRVWAAWNYLSAAPSNRHARDAADRPVAVSYLINKLQPLPFRTPVVVTLNPAIEPRAEHLLQRIEYAHPVFDLNAIGAQQRLADIQGMDRIWFAGAWTGYGFHEDGLKSGLAVAAAIGQLTASAQLVAA